MSKIINYKRDYLYFSIIALVVFGLISVLIATNNSYLLTVDNKVTAFFENAFGYPMMDYHHGIFNDVMTFLASYADAKPLVVITFFIAIILFIKNYRLLAFWLLAVVSTGGMLGIVVKSAIHRARPVHHLAIDNGFSFPSGHSVASTLLLLSILLVLVPMMRNQWSRIITRTVIILIWISILFSRLYFNAHHLSDLIGGVALGIFWVFVAMAIYGLTAKMFKEHLFKNSIV